jgi:hypothetical protein
MPVNGPDFISLQVRDLERSAAFYEQFLGLTRQPGPPHAVVFNSKPVAFAVRGVLYLGLTSMPSRSPAREWPCGCMPQKYRQFTMHFRPLAPQSLLRRWMAPSGSPSPSPTLMVIT